VKDAAPPRSGVRVSLAAVSAAVSTFLITILAARALTVGSDASAYSEFIVFWSLLSCCFGLIVGVQQETTRSVRSRVVSGARGGVRVVVVGTSLGAVISVIIVATGWLWAPRLLPLAPVSGVLAIGAGALAYSLFAVGVGTSGGLQEWGAYSGLLVLDAIGRLALVAGVALVGGGLGLIGWACVGSTAVAGLVLVMPRFRTLLDARGDRPLWPSLRATAYTMVSSAASVLLVSGYPALVSVMVKDADPTQMASVMTVVQLTRAPIMIPLMAFQGVAVSAFVTQNRSGFRALAKPVGLVLAVGFVGAPLAALLGPFLLRVLYGPTYAVPAGLFAVLVLASVSMALLTLSGTMTLALGRHKAYALGWLVAVGAVVGVLMLPLPLPEAAGWSLGVGPLAGVLVHVGALAVSVRRSTQTERR
jgi:O-antigen/teichoic acid export membrane protein